MVWIAVGLLLYKQLKYRVFCSYNTIISDNNKIIRLTLVPISMSFLFTLDNIILIFIEKFLLICISPILTILWLYLVQLMKDKFGFIHFLKRPHFEDFLVNFADFLDQVHLVITDYAEELVHYGTGVLDRLYSCSILKKAHY